MKTGFSISKDTIFSTLDSMRLADAMKNSFIKLALLSLICGLWVQCSQPEKRTAKAGIRTYTPASLQFDTLTYREKVYVPIYSEIYANGEDQYLPLLTSLSIRNTSQALPLYVRAVDYYDTEGHRIKAYLRQPIVLKPLQSVEFAVTQKEQGGAGANFIVDWGGTKTHLKPVIQAVMIGTAYQQGISFLTEGKTIEVLTK